MTKEIRRSLLLTCLFINIYSLLLAQNPSDISGIGMIRYVPQKKAANPIVMPKNKKEFCASIFKVVEGKRNSITGNDTLSNMNFSYYRIALAKGSFNRISVYPLISKENDIDTLEAIRELLNLKGDTRICELPIMGYNVLGSQLYMGANKDYSIQMEALFIINQLIMERPFVYSSYPVLVDKKSNSEASVSGPIVDKAFEAYCNWYLLIKKIGVQETRRRGIMPLDGTHLRWY